MAPLAHTLALLAMTVAPTAINEVPLDMAQDSFDDQYQGCGPEMTKELPALNRSDFHKDPLFARVWPKAVAEWQNKGFPLSPLSSPLHAIALMAYTMVDLHKKFNAAVRTAGRSPQEYRDNFHFKTFHFLLTQALVTLRDAQKGQCRCVYRGVEDYQFKAQHGQRVRFGQFASTSPCSKTADSFGTDTVFKVYTCYGVDIKKYSQFLSEKEVLVPPFETFEVTEVTQEGKTMRIHLNSTGTFSNYNCEWLRVGENLESLRTFSGSLSRNSLHLGGLLLATVAMAVVTGTL